MSDDSNIAFGDGPTVPIPGGDGAVTLGRYRLLRELGRGGFGTVWLAEERGDVTRRVAIKILTDPKSSREVVARFRQEVQAQAMMTHPGIAKVLAADTAPDGRPYYVMEYIKGLPITAFCDQRELSIRDRLELFRRVCDAVQHAHTKGVIHRDLKPSNIMAGLVDGAERFDSVEQVFVRVIDFGVAKAIDRPLIDATIITADFQMIGTAGYMSPEQARPDAMGIDTRSDVYSLGVLLYELLVGARPFTNAQIKDAMWKGIHKFLQETEPPPPSTRLSNLSRTGGEEGGDTATIARARRCPLDNLVAQLRRELEWIPLRAMAKLPDDRYRSPAELSDDVQRYLEGKPLVAGPRTFWYHAKKVARLYRAQVAVTAAILLSLVGGVVGTSWQAYRAEVARAQIAVEKAESDWRGYRATLLAAEGAIDRQEFGRAAETLAQAPIALRSWEYDYLKLQLPPADKGLRTEDPVLAIADAERGLRTIGLFRNSTLDGEIRHETPLPYVKLGGEICTAIAWTPDCGTLLVTPAQSPGRCVLAKSADGTIVRVFDAPAGSEPVIGAISADLSRVCIARRNGSALLLDASTGAIISTLPAACAFAFTADSATLIVADGKLSRYNAATGQPAGCALPGACADIGLGLTLEPSGRFALVRGSRMTELWDLPAQTRVWSVAPPASVAAFVDSERVLLGRGSEVELIQTSPSRACLTYRFTDRVVSAGLVPGTNRFWASTSTVVGNRVFAITLPPATYSDPNVAEAKLIASPDRTLIAAVEQDDKSGRVPVAFLNARTLERVAALTGAAGPPAFSDDSRDVWIARREPDRDITIERWAVGGVTPGTVLPLPPDAASATTIASRVGVAQSSDGRHLGVLVAGDKLASLHLRDMSSGAWRKLGEWPVSMLPESAARLVGIAFDPGGGHLIATLEGGVAVGVVASGTAQLVPVSGSPELLALSPDGARCAVGSAAGELTLIDLESMSVRAILGVPDLITADTLAGLWWHSGPQPRLICATTKSLTVWDGPVERVVFRGRLPSIGSCVPTAEPGVLLLTGQREGLRPASRATRQDLR